MRPARIVVPLALVLAFALGATAPAGEESEKPPRHRVLVELFTSQG